MLVDVLAKNRDAVVSRWFRLITETYPPDTAAFLQREKDQFLNPVGHTIAREIEALYDGLRQGIDAEQMSLCLDNIVRIRAVQEFSPSQAVGFVFLLKQALRESLPERIGEPLATELLAFESKIDGLALLAFNIFMQRREQIYELKANEVRNRAERLLSRLDKIYGISEQEDDREGPDLGPFN